MNSNAFDTLKNIKSNLHNSNQVTQLQNVNKKIVWSICIHSLDFYENVIIYKKKCRVVYVLSRVLALLIG